MHAITLLPSIPPSHINASFNYYQHNNNRFQSRKMHVPPERTVAALILISTECLYAYTLHPSSSYAPDISWLAGLPSTDCWLFICRHDRPYPNTPTPSRVWDCAGACVGTAVPWPQFVLCGWAWTRRLCVEIANSHPETMMEAACVAT